MASDLYKVVCGATHMDCVSGEPLSLSLHAKGHEDALQGRVVSHVLPYQAAPRYGAQVSAVVAQWRKKHPKKDTFWIGTFWGLTPEKTYVLKRSVTKKDGTKSSEAVKSATLQTEALPELYQALFSSKAAVHTLSNAQLLLRPDFAGCQVEQGSSTFMYMIAPEPLNFFSVTSLLPLLFYQGLFALPESVEVGPGQCLWMFALPNPPQRCILDLQDPALDQRNGAETSATDAAGAPICAYPWRRSKKVKRLIASNKYACVVRDTPAEIEAGLRRAAAYHMERHEDTWLSEEFITALAHLKPLMSVGPTEPTSTTTSLLKLLVVEMVERASGRVVAGCCGFALGSVYHDFTMYTVDRTAAAIGTVLTKLLGEALQQCGYNLWYWGMLIDYMEQFRASYGLRELDRQAFHERWGKYRDMLPRESVDAFLKQGSGMVPYLTAS